MRSRRFFLWVLCMVAVLSTLQVEAKIDQKRAEAYIKAVKQAQRKVTQFKQALKSRDPAKIKKATLEIQEDPAAIKELNKENTFVKKKFVDTTEAIQQRTIEGIKRRVAEKYGVKPEDVRIKKFTNPSSEVKAGHDWDVTVSVKGKGEIPLKESTGIVHESYFDAVGGQEAYPGSNPQTFAETHHVEVTNTGHAEAYEGGKKYIEKPKEYQVKDPERLSKTIEHKSHLEQKKAAEYRAKGEHAKAEVARHEQARQYTKQYEKHIKPRVEEMGGTIPKRVEKGTEILQKIGKYDPKLGRTYTPADADAALAKLGLEEGTKILQKIGKYDPKLGRTYTPADADAAIAKFGKHGETVESIIQKGSTLVESGQKLKTPAKGKGMKGSKMAEPLKPGASPKKTAPSGGGTTVAEEGMVIKGAKGVKRVAGKAVETVGTGIMIFNTAQDVKESLQGKKSWKETGKSAADLVTGGAISTTEQTVEKNRDADDVIKQRDKAQAEANEKEILDRGRRLRKNGVSAEETQKIMEQMRQGDNSGFYKKLHELRKEGKIIPLTVAKYVKLEGPDDTYGERAKATAEALVEYGKRAGRFVKQAGKDLVEITEGSFETQKNTVKAYLGQREAETQLEMIKEKLVASGVSPEAAQIAIDRYKDGHKETLRNTIKKLHKLEAEKKEKECIEAEKKAAKIRAMAQAKVRKERAKRDRKKALAKKAKMLLEKSRKRDKMIEAKLARKRLLKKIEESKRASISEHKKYEKMSAHERHEALKRGDADAWTKLEETLVKDMVLTKSQEKKLAQLSGTIHGGWSGRDKNNWKAKGRFTMHISSIGKVTGRYSGDASGSFSGFINSSGQMNVKMGGGRVKGGSWSGSVRKTASGSLAGSGRWSAKGYHGGWRGSGR